MTLEEVLCRKKPFIFACLLILASATYLVFYVSGWTTVLLLKHTFLQQILNNSGSNSTASSTCVGNSCMTSTSEKEQGPASNTSLDVLHSNITTSTASNSSYLVTNMTESSSLSNALQKDPGMALKESLAKSTSCSSLSKNLTGRILISSQSVTPEQLLTKYPYVGVGGRLKPQNCVSDQKVAIIIPYRDRSQHLHILLNNLVPVLHRQLVDAVIFVVEQALPTIFNRGSLFNIGFLESQKVGKFDCVIFHDVDMVPTHDSCMYTCGDHPRHFISYINSERLPYEDYFGGVVGMTSEQYVRINGHSNLYFGWGGEDDDLLLRCQSKGYRHVRYPMVIGHYYTFGHPRDKGNEPNPDRFRLLRTTSKRQDVEGLNTVEYDLVKLESRPLYTWMYVSVNMKQILQDAPDYMKADMIYLLRSIQ